MSWFSLSFTTAWLPFVRSLMDGASYSWNDSWFAYQFRGNGLEGDFWYAALKAAVAVFLLYFGWRRPTRLVRILLAVWLALALASVAYAILLSSASYRFRGNTLGIDISLTWIAPAVLGTMLALALRWALMPPSLPFLPFMRANKILLMAAGALLPVQYVLLSGASGQEAGDVLGVILTLLGWLLFCVGLALRPHHATVGETNLRRGRRVEERVEA